MKHFHLIELILNFISSIFWALITIVIFFYLKDSIINLISSIRKIGYGNTAIETNISKNQKEDSSIIELLGDGNDESYIDNALENFSNTTLEEIENIIERETKISEVEGVQNKYDRIFKYSKLLVAIKSFERIYDSIYGSQISLLQRLNHSISEEKKSLKIYFDKASKNNPVAYKDYPYDEYLNYLIIQGLIFQKTDSEILQITNLGKDFLRYMLETNLSLEKMY